MPPLNQQPGHTYTHSSLVLWSVCCHPPQAWQSAVPRDVLEGLLASEDMRHTHNLQGVAGCLVDLMEVPPQLVTAVDVVAGNQLFQVHDGCCSRSPGLHVLRTCCRQIHSSLTIVQLISMCAVLWLSCMMLLCCPAAVAHVQVVVDDDRVGLDLVKLLNKAGRGRVTFMPLNRLQVPDIAYPTQFKQDAVPLYKLLKCPDRYKKAVQQVCRTHTNVHPAAHANPP